MTENGPHGIIQDLVNNVVETKFAAFSREAIEYAKDEIIDVIGCAIGGVNASGNRAMLDLVREWGGKKEATIIGFRGKVPSHYAAMMNSIMARSYDYEGGSPSIKGRMTGHISGTIVPTAFAVAEQKKASGAELLTALILGGDLTARLAAAEDFSFENGFDTSGMWNKYGAAAIAGRLSGLDHQQLLNAFGIVVNLVSGTFQSIWDGANSFKLHEGFSSRDGIVAAELAHKGFTGVKDALFSPLGHYSLYCQSYDKKYLIEGLGKTFYVKGGHKKYPCCTGNHIAITCGLKILSQYDPRAEDITRITLRVTPKERSSFLNQPYDLAVAGQVKATFSLPYNIANVLIRKGARLEHFLDEAVRDPAVIDLAGKVRIEPALPPEKGMAVELIITTKDGKQYSAYEDKSPSLETRDEIKDKYWANVDFSHLISRENAGRALELLENLEEIDDINKIMRFLS